MHSVPTPQECEALMPDTGPDLIRALVVVFRFIGETRPYDARFVDVTLPTAVLSEASDYLCELLDRERREKAH